MVTKSKNDTNVVDLSLVSTTSKQSRLDAKLLSLRYDMPSHQHALRYGLLDVVSEYDW